MSPAECASLLVVCFCAEWCGTCRDYRATFEQAERAAGASAVRYAWIDVEDHDAVLGNLDVENFPTLLIARGNDVLFYGTVLPHARTLARLVQNALDGEFTPLAAPELQGLPARVRAALPASA